MYDYSEYDDPAYARGLSQKYIDYINALMEINYMTQERAEQYFDELDNEHLERIFDEWIRASIRSFRHW